MDVLTWGRVGRVGRVGRAGGAAAVMAGLGIGAHAPAFAAETPPPSITVSGEASAEVVPDTARLTLGVEVERSTATAASNDLATAAQAVRAQIKADAIADRDVATTALSLEPLLPDDPVKAARGPRGFRASTFVVVTIRPAERAGDVASQLVDKGATTISGIDYAFSEQEHRLDDLRADAMRDALHKAQVYTGAIGLHLGPVLQIMPRDGDALPPPAPMMAMRKAVAPLAMIPTAPGTLHLSTGVSVRWEIAP